MPSVPALCCRYPPFFRGKAGSVVDALETFISSPTKQTPNINTVISTVIASDGNIHLAAERLSIPLSDLISLLSAEDNLDSLKKQLRVRSLFTLYDITQNTAARLQEVLVEMEPAVVSRTYLGAITQLNEALKKDPANTNVNVNQNNVSLILEGLPPDVKEAVLALSAQNPSPSIIDVPFSNDETA